MSERIDRNHQLNEHQHGKLLHFNARSFYRHNKMGPRFCIKSTT